MPENESNVIRELLQKATRDTEALQARLQAGEEVSEEEMTAIARSVALAIEEANQKLHEMLGPMDSALLREKMVENMTPEEFEEWSEDNPVLQQHRAAKSAEGQNG